MECGGWNPSSIVLDLYKLGQITAPLTQLVFMFVICFKEMIYRLQFIGHPFHPKYIKDRLLLFIRVYDLFRGIWLKGTLSKEFVKNVYSTGSCMLPNETDSFCMCAVLWHRMEELIASYSPGQSILFLRWKDVRYKFHQIGTNEFQPQARFITAIYQDILLANKSDVVWMRKLPINHCERY